MAAKIIFLPEKRLHEFLYILKREREKTFLVSKKHKRRKMEMREKSIKAFLN
jgi:hypothetical protein